MFKDLDSGTVTEVRDAAFKSLLQSFVQELDPARKDDTAVMKMTAGVLSVFWLATLRMTSSYLYDILEGMLQNLPWE
jgi:hypothetical protein